MDTEIECRDVIIKSYGGHLKITVIDLKKSAYQKGYDKGYREGYREAKKLYKE